MPRSTSPPSGKHVGRLRSRSVHGSFKTGGHVNHWFDETTRDLARGTFSRRALLARLLQGTFAAVGTRLLGSLSVLAITPRTAAAQASTCTVRQEGERVVLSLSARDTFKGRALSLTKRVESVRRVNVNTRTVIAFGDQPLIQVDAGRLGTELNQIRIRYGEAFVGVRTAGFTTDGKVLQGTFDGRRIRPFVLGSDVKSLTFEDGKPPPSVKVASEVPAAISLIFQKAQKEFTGCTFLASLNNAKGLVASAGPLSAFPSLTLPDEVSPQADASTCPGPTGSNPKASDGCTACKGVCTANGIACGVILAASCGGALIFYAICLALGLVGCAIAVVSCIAVCHATGQPCCPVSCGDVACCMGGDACLNTSTGVCCAEGSTPCGNRCCCGPKDECIKATGACCPAGQIVCNNVCCKANEVCKDGVTCCPPKQVVCNGVCCGPGEQCTGGRCCPDLQVCGKACCDELSNCADPAKGVCCSFASVTCGSICCPPGDVCLNGQCCASTRVCGQICCNPGHTCVNAQKQQCTLCPTGQVPAQCYPPGPGICCPQGISICCLGKCCQPGQLCCSRTGLPLGCHNASLCVA